MSNELLAIKEKITKLSMLIDALETSIKKYKYMTNAYRAQVKLDFHIKLINLDIFKDRSTDTLEEIKSEGYAKLIKYKHYQDIAINDLLTSAGNNIHLQSKLDYDFLSNMVNVATSSTREHIKLKTKNIYEIKSLHELINKIGQFKSIINEHNIYKYKFNESEHVAIKTWIRSQDKSLSCCQLYLFNGIAEITKQ